MTSRPCPSCGHENPEHARYCAECGHEVGASLAESTAIDGSPGALSPTTREWPGPVGSSRPPAPTPSLGDFTPPPWRWIPAKRDANRTRDGLAILAVAALVGLAPLVGPILYFVLGLIGAVPVFAARLSFGPDHRSNVKASLVAWILGFIVGVVGIAYAVVVILQAAPSGPPGIQGALSTIVDIILVTTFLTALLYGVAWVLLPYGLSTVEGHVFLWSAFGIDLAASLALALFYREELVASLSQAAMTGGTEGLDPFGGTVASLQFLSVASAGLYAVAYLYASVRVGRGDVSPLTPL